MDNPVTTSADRPTRAAGAERAQPARVPPRGRRRRDRGRGGDGRRLPGDAAPSWSFGAGAQPDADARPRRRPPREPSGSVAAEPVGVADPQPARRLDRARRQRPDQGPPVRRQPRRAARDVAVPRQRARPQHRRPRVHDGPPGQPAAGARADRPRRRPRCSSSRSTRSSGRSTRSTRRSRRSATTRCGPGPRCGSPRATRSGSRSRTTCPSRPGCTSTASSSRTSRWTACRSSPSCRSRPGEIFTYEFTATPAGSHMYHSHHNATDQVGRGLLGAFIVEPKRAAESYARKYGVTQEVVFIHNDARGRLHDQRPRLPGHDPDRRQGGRQGPDPVHERGHDDAPVAHPRVPHEHRGPRRCASSGRRPSRADTLGVNPGERWDAIIDCDRPGVWAFHCHILPHVEGADGMFGMVTALVDPAARRDLTTRDMTGSPRRCRGLRCVCARDGSPRAGRPPGTRSACAAPF